MFKELRKKRRELSKEEALNVLKEGREGVLSTIGENGYPYGIAVNHVYHDGCIYFHCSNKGNKLDNIKLNDKVSFFVSTDINIVAENFTTHYKSAVVFGRASIIEDKEKRDVMIAIGEKYSLPFMDKGIHDIDKAPNACTVVKIEIDYITGKYSDGSN
ncbi:pyridoxamine 5'-phosphate oxidase family protein [Clostridium sp.]|uniref:pyridoxamine 5'-phosphate oxidase family protein n=1 Tax=Clostridium sp. TaxID=1506 RepID=UPI002FC609FD